MWVLAVLNLTAGSMTSIGGFSSVDSCAARGSELIASFVKQAHGSNWYWNCFKPD